MGGETSRCIVPTDEAKRRLGYERAGQVDLSWRKLSRGGKGVPLETFRDEFLHSVLPCMPRLVSDALFAALDSRSCGLLSVDDLLSGLCVLYKGSPEERLKLLFHILDEDRDDRVSQKDVLRFITACEEQDVDAVRRSMQHLRTDRISSEAFSRWHEGNPELVSWIRQFETARLSPHHQTMVSSQIEEHERVIATTLGIPSEIFENLEKAHEALKEKSKLGVVCKATISELPTSSLTRGVFESLDMDRKGTISLHDLVTAVGTWQIGTVRDKLKFCYHLFTNETQPTLTRSKARSLLEAISDIPGVYTLASIPSHKHPPIPDAILLFLDDLPEETPCDTWVEWGTEHIPSEQVNDFVTAAWQLASIDLRLQPETRQKEVEILKRLNDIPNKEGVRWFLTSKAWWDKVMDPSSDVPTMPSIVNQCLLDACLNLRQDISEGEDYAVVSHGVWKAVTGWYGLVSPISRTTVVRDGRLVLELYPLTVRVALGSPENAGQAEQLREFQISGTKTAKDVVEIMCSKTGALPDGAKLFEKDGTEVPADETLETMDFADGHFFLLDVPTEDVEASVKTPDLAPRGEMSSFCSSFAYDSPDGAVSLTYGSKVECHYHLQSTGGKSQNPVKGIVRSTGDEIKVAVLSRDAVVTTHKDWVVRALPAAQTWDGCTGRVGLQNLGNTCYMNSVLQVLSNTRTLRDYFVHQAEYAYDLNTTSTWGMGGKVTIAFAELLESLWCTSETTAPRRFRGVFGNFKPEYAQYMQQDAEEFLSELLSALSAELSDECKEEYVEFKDAEDRPDEEVASERWDDLLKREHSVITNLFFSQFKSQLTCTKCNLVTRNFPYLSIIPLPLPEFPHKYYEVTMHLGGVPLKVSLKASHDCEIQELLKECVEIGGGCEKDYVPAVLTESMSCLVAMPGVGEKLSTLHGQQLHMYKVPGHCEGNNIIPVVHRRYVTIANGESFEIRARPVTYGYVMMASVKQGTPYEAMREQLWEQCKWMMPDYKLRDEKYPFIVTTVTKDGNGCSSCSWVKGCFGCLFNTTPVDKAISIDWESSLLNKYDNSRLMDHMNIKVHPSIKQHRDEVAAGLTCDLQACLDNYTKTEMPKICGRCTKDAGEPTETGHKEEAEMYRVPPVLIVQLKKFMHNNMTGQSKINGLVQFPIKDFDVASWSAGSSQHISDTAYDLYGVINHRGAYGHGHYYSYILNGGKWYCYNDSIVTPMKESEVVTPEAYILFYKARNATARRLRSVWPRKVDKGAEYQDIIDLKNQPWSRPTNAAQKKNRNCVVM